MRRGTIFIPAVDLSGILPSRPRSKKQEESFETRGFAYCRGTTIPGHDNPGVMFRSWDNLRHGELIPVEWKVVSTSNDTLIYADNAAAQHFMFPLLPWLAVWPILPARPSRTLLERNSHSTKLAERFSFRKPC